MAENKGIPPNLAPRVLELAGEGRTTRQIAEALLTDHGIKVSHVAVARLLKATREERAGVAKTVVREKLAATIAPDLDALASETQRVRRLCLRLYNRATRSESEELTGMAKAYFAGAEQLRKNIETTMRLAGADTPDDSLTELAAAQARVAGRIDRLAAAGRESEGAAGTGADPDGAGGA
jgi:hypothetical protein